MTHVRLEALKVFAVYIVCRHMQDADVRELQPLGTLYDERGRQAASGNEINHDAAFAVFPVVGAWWLLSVAS